MYFLIIYFQSSSRYHRVFALANKKDELEFEQRSMASLLAKFRIDYSDLTLIPDITKKPDESTTKYFNSLIKDFRTSSNSTDGESSGIQYINIFSFAFNTINFFFFHFFSGHITDTDLITVQDKTNRHLRLREFLLQNSSKSDLVVMTLPMPRKHIVAAPLYMAWLEALSEDLPPFLFVRGNQTSVLTFYS